MAWTDLSPDDPRLEEFARLHQIHPLHIEDCRSDEQQAKLDRGTGYLFIVLKVVSLVHDELAASDLDVFLGESFLATVHKSPVPLLDELSHNASIQSIASDELFYRVLDAVVDSYLLVLDDIEDRVDLLEDHVVRQPTQDVLERIADLVATLLEMRRVLANTRRIAFALTRSDMSSMRAELQPFLRDVLDHLERDLASASNERERLKGLLDIYHSSLASANNEATRILTVMGTVSLPAVVICSFMGMSLKYPGWANWPGAILIVIALIVAVTAGLLIFLKRKRYF